MQCFVLGFCLANECHGFLVISLLEFLYWQSISTQSMVENILVEDRVQSDAWPGLQLLLQSFINRAWLSLIANNSKEQCWLASPWLPTRAIEMPDQRKGGCHVGVIMWERIFSTTQKVGSDVTEKCLCTDEPRPQTGDRYP